MPKLNFPKTIISLTLSIAFILIAGFLVCGYSEIKKARESRVNFVEPVKPVENNNQEPKPIEPVELIEPTEPVEQEEYQAELFLSADWGDGEGEVGLQVVPPEPGYYADENSAEEYEEDGLAYGPQSFEKFGKILIKNPLKKEQQKKA